MANWQPTHGRVRGSYVVVDGIELFVRQAAGSDGVPTGRWKLYVNGALEGEAGDELAARSAGELTARDMIEAEAARVAAAARQGDRAA